MRYLNEKGKCMTIQADRPRLSFGLNTNFMKRIGITLFATALITQPFGGAVNALQVLNFTAVPFTPTEVATNWAADRTLPSDGYTSVNNFQGRDNVLEMSLNKNKQSTLGAFYHTEGLQRQVPASSSIKADLYVNSDEWKNKTVRAGLWGVGQNGTNTVTSYPILEYTTDGFTGWRYWDVDRWVNLPGASFNDKGWNTLAITHDKANNTFDLSINNIEVASVIDEGSTHLGAAILNSKNYGLDNYKARWSNFAYGSYSFVAETPTNAKFSNPAVCGGHTNQMNTVASWSQVTNATSYTYKSWKDSHATYNSLENAYTVNLTGTSQPGAFNIGEGKYYFSVQAVYADGQKSDWSTPCAATYDTTKPASKITDPSRDNLIKTGKVKVTGAATDTNIKSHWFEITGPNSYVAYFNNMNTSDSTHSFDWDTAGLAEGTYKIRYVASDRAGNRSDDPSYSKPTIRTVIVDHTAPVGDITYPADTSTIVSTGGKIAVNGTVTENTLMNRVGVQLVKPGVSGHIQYLYHHMVNQNPGTWNVEFDAAALTLANGTYGLNLYFTDMAGNTSIKKTTFTLNNPTPAVNTEDFGVGSWTVGDHGFAGLNVGFNVHDFKTISGVTVELHNENGLVDTNTASSSLLTMLNEGRIGPSLSTAFVAQGTLVDTWCDSNACWDLGGHTWTHDSKTPTKTVIKVTGNDIYGKTVTKVATNENFSQAGGSFVDVLPDAPAPAVLGTNTNSNSNSNSSSAPQITRASAPRVNPNPNFFAFANETPVELVEDLDEKKTQPSVLAANDSTDETSPESGEESDPVENYTGNWVWWTVGGGAFAATTWWVAAALRRRING